MRNILLLRHPVGTYSQSDEISGFVSKNLTALITEQFVFESDCTAVLSKIV